MEQLLERLMRAPPAPTPIDDIEAWDARHQAAALGLALPVERAAAAGCAMDRPGYAFASGYREALRQLLPALGEARAVLCATEAGGAHPRAILTRLEADGLGLRLSGEKRWVTLGTHAEVLLVVASEGQDVEGRKRLALVRVPAGRAGVAIEPQPPTPFVPEVPHATLRLDRVAIDPGERLPGDGYERYLRPFRTIEDLHVHAAILGWLLQVARRAGWPRGVQQHALLLIAAACAMARAAPGSPALHLALGGLIDGTARILGELEPLWAQADPESRGRWERDRPLLQVAGGARAQRLQVAWERVHALS